MHSRRLVVLAATAMLAFGAAPCVAQVVYVNDFESGATAGWSTSIWNPPFQRDIAISATPSGRRFLGPFGSQVVALRLPALPPHDELLVSFDLFVIQSWDGSNDGDGPDLFSLTEADDGATLLRTSFSNNAGLNQTWPGGYPGPTVPARTGAAENNTLRYPREGDAVYRISLRFPHTAADLALEFAAELRDRFPTVENESWGIDNITITAFGPAVASATLEVLDAQGSTGEDISVPIRLTDRVGFGSTRATAIRGELRFNASMLHATAQTPRGFLDGRERVIPLELPILERSDSIIALIPLQVLTGDDTVTALRFTGATAVGDTMALTTLSGTFTLVGGCRDGGARLIDPWPALTLRPVGPNPASDVTRLGVSVRTESTVSARLLDVRGRTRWQTTVALAAGEHDVLIDLGELATGVYRLVIDADGIQHVQRLVVLR